MRWFPLTQESGPIALAYWWLPDPGAFPGTDLQFQPSPFSALPVELEKNETPNLLSGVGGPLSHDQLMRQCSRMFPGFSCVYCETFLGRILMILEMVGLGECL